MDRLNIEKAAVLKELTLRFRTAAKEALEGAHARELSVWDGRPREPLPQKRIGMVSRCARDGRVVSLVARARPQSKTSPNGLGLFR